MKTKLKAGDVCYLKNRDDSITGNFFFMLSPTTMVWLTGGSAHGDPLTMDIQAISEWGTPWFTCVEVVFNIGEVVEVVKNANGD